MPQAIPLTNYEAAYELRIMLDMLQDIDPSDHPDEVANVKRDAESMRTLRAFPCNDGHVTEEHAGRLTDGVCWCILFEPWN